jgi:hypothetical protein
MSHLDPARVATRSELRSFGLLVGGAFIVLAAFVAWKTGLGASAVPTLGAVGGVLVATGLVAPRLLGVPYRAWMRFAVLLSRVTTPVFMGVIYFVLLTPLALFMRAVGRNPLRTRTGDTFWATRPAGSRASLLERQF